MKNLKIKFKDIECLGIEQPEEKKSVEYIVEDMSLIAIRLTPKNAKKAFKKWQKYLNRQGVHDDRKTSD
jgi:hypothetical protein